MPSLKYRLAALWFQFKQGLYQCSLECEEGGEERSRVEDEIFVPEFKPRRKESVLKMFYSGITLSARLGYNFISIELASMFYFLSDSLYKLIFNSFR